MQWEYYTEEVHFGHFDKETNYVVEQINELGCDGREAVARFAALDETEFLWSPDRDCLSPCVRGSFARWAD